MPNISSVTAGNGQALPGKLVIGERLLALWLDGRVEIKPIAEAWRPPSERRAHKPHALNGNGALPDDDAVARFIVVAGVERVRRVLAQFDQQQPLPLHVTEGAPKWD